jgi:hypothetical protein
MSCRLDFSFGSALASRPRLGRGSRVLGNVVADDGAGGAGEKPWFRLLRGRRL